MFFCRFAFFISPADFSKPSVSQPICTKFGTKASSCIGLKQPRAIFEKFKNQVTTAKKHRKIAHFFTPALTFSLAVTKRLKFFEKSFLRLPLGCYTFQKMYLRQFRTVQFSQSLGSMERQKSQILRAIISQTVTVTVIVSMQCR